MTRLASSLPKGTANGLGAISQTLVDDPHRVHAVVALVDCKKVSTDFDTGEVVPTARIRRIEVVLDAEHLELVEKVIRRSLAIRQGKEVLPIDLEDELNEVFAQINFDPVTGEVLDEDEGGAS